MLLLFFFFNLGKKIISLLPAFPSSENTLWDSSKKQPKMNWAAVTAVRESVTSLAWGLVFIKRIPLGWNLGNLNPESQRCALPRASPSGLDRVLCPPGQHVLPCERGSRAPGKRPRLLLSYRCFQAEQEPSLRSFCRCEQPSPGWAGNPNVNAERKKQFLTMVTAVRQGR